VVEVLGGELCGEHVVIGMTATPGAHPVQDRFAIGGEVERLWYDARGFQQPSPQTSLDLTADIRG